MMRTADMEMEVLLQCALGPKPSALVLNLMQILRDGP